MPTIRFDWDKWTRSQWFGFPKNRMWGKVRNSGHDESGQPTKQYTGEVVGSNPESLDTGIGDLARDHRFTGYRSDVYNDAAGDVEDAEWADHYKDEVDNYQLGLPVIDRGAEIWNSYEDVAYDPFTFEATGTLPITWSAEGLPDGLTLSEDGILSGTPGEGTAGQNYPFTLTATNRWGSDNWATSILVDTDD